MTRVLLLGGTTEASILAQSLASANIETVFSYAGRTQSPKPQPLPTRIGGFGGVEGLRSYLVKNEITHLVDATHPFATGMSHNAAAASVQSGVPLIRLERPAWQPQEGDDWVSVPSVEAVPEMLPRTPATIFLAIGKQHVDIFASRPEHHYVLRFVDQPETPPPLPRATVLVARGPFNYKGDLMLMQAHGITHIVAKNAGGPAARAKLDAARTLGLSVFMVDRPVLPEAAFATTVEEVLAFLGHVALRGV